ncbi:aminopeptidase P N-terminal domain-containing protein, partial [Oceanospirillaceae bacterium]|nr:aminopeptidase P N-terminal domain-containing protein [Oceanospirillaceae bacterium]
MTKIATIEYVQRRNALLQQLPIGAVVIVNCASVQIRNGDVEQDYRQNSSFYYLSGMVEPHTTLVLVNSVDGPRSILFCRSKDKLQEIWHGRRLGVDAAPKILLVDEAHVSESLEQKLVELLDGASQVVYRFSQDETFELVQQSLAKLRRLSRQGKVCPTTLVDLDPLID